MHGIGVLFQANVRIVEYQARDLASRFAIGPQGVTRNKSVARMSDFTPAYARHKTQTSSNALFWLVFTLWCGLLAFFNAFPSIDVSVAQTFFSESQCRVLDVSRVCGEFGYGKSLYLDDIRKVLFALPYIAALILTSSLVLSRWKASAGFWSQRTEMSFAALITLALGCGLLVNMFLKAFSGRPRPRETTLFGGNLDFVQAGSFAGKCIKNCSFVSGEASSAGWLFCLILLLPSRWRLLVGVPLAVVSFVVPTLRVVAGAHYLSDVTLGWLSSIVIFAAVLAIMEKISGRRYIDM
jgi:lipid A 4'-phosphatase